MIKLPNQFYEEFDRIQNHKILTINQYDWNTIHECRDVVLKFGNTSKYTFLYNQETITNLDYLDEIYKIIEDYKIDAIISTSTASTFNKSAHPLTNLLMWKNAEIRKNISWNSQENVPIFNNNFFYGKLVNENREFKGILSVRKKTEIRDYLFNKKPKINNGIVRYANWPVLGVDEIYHESLISNFPTNDILISEYNNSYFSFVVESEHGNSYGLSTSNLTEKTLISILTGTIPIVLGSKSFVSDLNKMGIKVWNDEFGFGLGDSFSSNSKHKIDSFFNCIQNVNKLSISEAKEYWIKNKKEIQHNYNLVSRILFDVNLI